MQNARKPSYYQFDWLDCIDPSRNLLTEEQYVVVKRIMDLILTIAAMPVWLTVVVLCAILVKLESPRDPIFFRQMRTGKGGRRFPMIKFRTMVVNAEKLEAELAHLSKLKWPDFKIENDPRVTKVGRLLRRTSLDEFPQFFNVLRGDMSLVGPRPTVFSTDEYKLWQTARLEVMPGITGLWQITARAELEFYERVRLDLIYVQRRCLRLDIEILVRTIPAVLGGHGAF